MTTIHRPTTTACRTRSLCGTSQQFCQSADNITSNLIVPSLKILFSSHRMRVTITQQVESLRVEQPGVHFVSDKKQASQSEALPGPEAETIAPPSQPPVSEGGSTQSESPPCGPTLPLIPGYEILRELGRGGMGVVYQARQVSLNRLVALKMILAGSHASEADLARFHTEAKAIAALHHPHIVQVYEIGEHEGKPYFSLEFCAGGSLARKLDGTPLPPQGAAHLVETLARAMEAAHQKGIIHRDLKPANVLHLEDGTPKVTDFGLAKKLNEAGQTASGAVLGTPSYMAPEQASGKGKEVGPPADVYALGAILYELLTGRPPFRAPSVLDTLLQVVSDEPVPPRQLQSKTPRDLETICLKCLQKKPGKRYASALALAEDLRRYQAGETILARPAGNLERAVKWVKRRPLVAALVGAVILVTLVGVAGITWQWKRAENRLWQSLLEQVRAERLAGNRQRSLEAVREALKINNSLELRQQALQSILASGVQPLECAPESLKFVEEKHFVQGKSPATLDGALVGHDVLAISGDGLVAVLQHQKTHVAWDIRARKPIASWEVSVPPGHQRMCCLSQEGDLFAFVPWDVGKIGDHIKIYETRTGKLKAELSRMLSSGNARDDFGAKMSFSPDGSFFASELPVFEIGNKALRIWSLGSGAELATLREWHLDVRAPKIPSSLPAVSSWRQVSGAWTTDGRLVRLRFGANNGAFPVVWTDPDQRLRVKLLGEESAVNPGYLKGPADPVLWQVVDSAPSYRIQGRVESLSFRPDGKELATNNKIWSVANNQG
ncbi:MAG TPA: serine/threonine-protein kinase, partial [Gemmataceae bacterium]|nr:serine/threonine-protein kinase [Gemmataceae bacterium]